MAGPNTRVLIVDDSAISRRLLARALSEDGEIDVVAEAGDAFSANALIAQHRPDLMTLDLEMPKMDGIAFLQHLMRHQPLPVIVVSAHTREGSIATIEALRAGAVDVILKPQNPVALASFGRRLRRRIHEIRQYAIRVKPPIDGAAVPRAPLPSPIGEQTHALVAIGASTGGPQAIETVLAQLPAESPPLVIVQHMPATFTGLFAKRLNATSALRVVEATHHQTVTPGVAYIAPGGYHLTVEQREGRLSTSVGRGAPVNHQRPSVDVLFRSLVGLTGISVVGVLLTGMGSDGADAMVSLVEAGYETIAEDEQSCVVFGMPREAIARGGARHVAPLAHIPAMIVECLSRSEHRARRPVATGPTVQAQPRRGC